MNTILSKSLVLLSAFTFALSVSAEDPIYTGSFSNKAVGGYDTVSYFQGTGKPEKGVKDFQTEWRGATWFFANAENLEKFKADPEKYAPQYGGYCAWAVSQGYLAKGDPLVYEKVGDKIYLNYNQDVSDKWEPEKDTLIPAADEKYSGLVDL